MRKQIPDAGTTVRMVTTEMTLIMNVRFVPRNVIFAMVLLTKNEQSELKVISSG